MAVKKVLDLSVDIETKGVKKLDGAGKSFKKFTSLAKKASKGAKAFASASSNMASKIGPAVAGMTAAVAGFTILAKTTFDAADNIAKTADKIGMTTDALQELRYAANRTGVASNVLDTAMQRFSRRVGEVAKGTGVLKPIFEEYNIQLKDSYGKTKSLNQIFNEYANIIQKTPSDQERLRLSVGAFDMEAAKMVLTMKDGAAGIDVMRRKARGLGLVIDENLLRSAEAANDAMDDLIDSIKARFTTAVLKMAPTIEALAGSLLELMPYLQDFLNVIMPYMPIILPLIGGLTALGLTFITIINPLIQIGSLLFTIAAAFIGVTGGAAGLVIALAVLGVAVTALWLKFEKPEVFADLANWIQAWFDVYLKIVRMHPLVMAIEYVITKVRSLMGEFSAAKAAITSVDQFISKPRQRKPKNRSSKSMRDMARGFRTGGGLPGYGGGDKVKALLEQGEFVIRKEAVRKYGKGIFSQLNNMNMPNGRMKFATGGEVPAPAQNNNFNFSAPITATGSGMEDVFRDSIIPELKKALRNNTNSITTLLRQRVR